MKNSIFRYLIKSIFFYTCIFIVVFTIINLIVNALGYSFLKLVFTITISISIAGFTIGTIQIANWLKNKKALFFISLTLVILEIAILGVFIFLYNTIYPKEEQIIVDNKKLMKISHYELISNDIEYYDYINQIMRGKKIKIFEDYSDGVGSNYLHSIYYYDDDGNLIKEYDNDNKKTIYVYNKDKEKAENETRLKSIEQATNKEQKSQEVVEPEILYEKKFDEKTGIRIVNREYVLAQRQIIEVEKTYDGGNTWIEQNESEDGFIQIHIGAKFVFIDEYIGFINDPGLTGTNGENRGFLVTTDGGKNFNDAIVQSDYSMENLYIDDIPYKENDILKVKIYIVENSEKKYYDFYSDDNGISWKKVT